MNNPNEQPIETREPVGENAQQPQPPVIENEKIKEATHEPVPDHPVAHENTSADKFQHESPAIENEENTGVGPESKG